MPKPRDLNPAYRFAAAVVRPVVRRVTKQDWAGHEHFPREGGFVLCPNHISYVDVFAFAHFAFDGGREPYLLGKESVFRIPGVGRLLAKAGMIPVYRESGQAASAFRAAIDAVRAGKCVAIYPEGTLTWRVQAVDSDDNGLTWSSVETVTKASPRIVPTSPTGSGSGSRCPTPSSPSPRTSTTRRPTSSAPPWSSTPACAARACATCWVRWRSRRARSWTCVGGSPRAAGPSGAR